jgi:hypothetical protein
MEDYTHAISGLIRRREELRTEAHSLADRQAAIINDLDAIERSLQSLGHSGPFNLRPVRQARIILFYRNELRGFLRGELEKRTEPVLTRELAVLLCQMEGKAPEDRRLLSDVSRRVCGALAQMRDMGQVTRTGSRKIAYWELVRAPVGRVGETG